VSPTAPGSLVKVRWSPLRAEIERILADGAWHEDHVLFRRVEGFVDPRIAARSWARQYYRYDRTEQPPASEVWVTRERVALRVGRRGVYWDTVRPLIDHGRVQCEVWGGRRRLRLAPDAAR
jgi:hypothetical protein